MMPPETEENGTHTQEPEMNCSLQHIYAVAQNQRMCANVDCSRWTYCVVYGTWGEKKKKKTKKGFSLFGNKINYSKIRIIISIS